MTYHDRLVKRWKRSPVFRFHHWRETRRLGELRTAISEVCWRSEHEDCMAPDCECECHRPAELPDPSCPVCGLTMGYEPGCMAWASGIRGPE